MWYTMFRKLQRFVNIVMHLHAPPDRQVFSVVEAMSMSRSRCGGGVFMRDHVTNPLVSIDLTLFVVVIVVVAGVVYPLYGSSSAAMKRAARHFVLTELPCVREITPGCGGSVFVGFDCILSTNVMSYARASAHS